MLCGYLVLSVILLVVVNAGQPIDPASNDQIKAIKAAIKRHSAAQQPLVVGQLYMQMGMLYQQQDLAKHSGGDLQKKALQAYDKALSLPIASYLPLVVQINYQKGILLKMMGQGDSSVAALSSLLPLPLHPADMAAVHYYLADSHLLLGDLEGAVREYRASIALAPCKTERYFGLVSALREMNSLTPSAWGELVHELVHRANDCPLQQAGDATDKEMVLFSSATAAFLPSKRADILYAISYIYDKLQNPLSFQYLAQANAIEKQQRGGGFNAKDAVQQFNNTAMVFGKDFWTHLIRPSVDTVAPNVTLIPIFVLGMMRSGSTLLESMLDSHSDIVGIGEESIFNAHLLTLRDGLVQASTSPRNPRKPYESMHQVVREFKKKMNQLMYAKVKGRLAPAAGPGRTIYVVDKMLFNYRNIGFIHLVYPNAPILHIHRDPMDTLYSIFKYKFDDHGLDWSLDMADTSVVYALYLEYMHHFRSLLPGRITDIRYEDMVRNSQDKLVDLFEALKIPFEKEVLEFHKNNRSVLTHSQSQVRQKLFQTSIGSWRKYAEQMLPLVAPLRPHLAHLKAIGALAFNPDVNWDLAFDHPDYPKKSDKVSEVVVELTGASVGPPVAI